MRAGRRSLSAPRFLSERGGPVRAPRSPDSGRLRGKPALRPSSAAGRGGRAVRFACVIALYPAGAHRLRACLRTDAEALAASRRSREASRTRPPPCGAAADGRRGMPARASMRPPPRKASAVRRSLGEGGACRRSNAATRRRRLRLARRRSEPCRLAHASPTGRGRLVRHCRARASAGAHDDRRPPVTIPAASCGGRLPRAVALRPPRRRQTGSGGGALHFADAPVSRSAFFCPASRRGVRCGGARSVIGSGVRRARRRAREAHDGRHARSGHAQADASPTGCSWRRGPPTASWIS